MKVSRISFFMGIMLSCFQVCAQDEKGAFSSAMQLSLNACQIDGDGASGYNKFGYTLGTVIAQNLGKGWQYETGIAFSERGARYPFNPDLPGRPAFHYRYQTVDLPLFFNKNLDAKWLTGLGVRTTYLIKARETEGINLHVVDNSRKAGMLICAKVQYKTGKAISYRVEYQYGLVSISSSSSGSMFFPTGAYHNCISAGIQYSLSSKTE
ncbi:MAG: outer membrane beta-barrel protein [Sphingomonadales bacterium]|jgi:hypothetical protein